MTVPQDSDDALEADDVRRALAGAMAGPTTPASPRSGRAFWALLERDVYVTGKELIAFLAQVLMQPLFLLFVFGKVLADLGFTQHGYAHVLFPGIVALTAFLTALQNTAFPLVIDFSYTKEIEDRLLAPLSTNMVAIEKIVFATLRALVAAAIMFPMGRWMLGPLTMTWSDAPTVALFLILGCLVGASIGMTLGTLVKPAQINIVFALVLAPLMFTGSIQFPWPELTSLRWFQVICAFNPLTYLSEAVRGEMLPGVSHIGEGICLLVLLGFLALFGATGILGFRHRALD